MLADAPLELELLVAEAEAELAAVVPGLALHNIK